MSACTPQSSNDNKEVENENINSRQIEFKRISGFMREIEDMMQAKTTFNAERVKVLTKDLQQSSQNVFQYFSEQEFLLTAGLD